MDGRLVPSLFRQSKKLGKGKLAEGKLKYNLKERVKLGKGKLGEGKSKYNLGKG